MIKHQINIEDWQGGELFRGTLASQVVTQEDYSKELCVIYKDLKIQFEVYLNKSPVRFTTSLDEAVEKYNSI